MNEGRKQGEEKHCSFCGKSEKERLVLITTPTDPEVGEAPFICEVCMGSSLVQMIKIMRRSLADSLKAVVKEKDNAYNERNQCVAAMAKMAMTLGWSVGLGEHEDDDWDCEWRNVIYIDTPEGQTSWHIHDSELPLFEGIPQYTKGWDKHTTQEKYQRLSKI